MPALTIIPAFAIATLGINPRLAVLLPPLLFLAWNPGLLNGSKSAPKRSYGLLLILIALDVAWFVYGWRLGLEYEGAQYTHAVAYVNLMWVVPLGALASFERRGTPSFAKNLALHCAIFVWLAWYAFPYLGELP